MQDGVFVTFDDVNLTKVHALIVGPPDTPYEGGFFYFVLDIPDDFPNQPPKVILHTTDGGRVRFNPNLYASGKVCLSILGTFAGPGWSPALSISSVLLSIQSLMNDRPFCNEPGFENPINRRDIDLYNECIAHETIRVAVCDMLEDTPTSRELPPAMRLLARDVAPGFLDAHQDVCEKRMAKNGTPMHDPQTLLERISVLKAKLGSGLDLSKAEDE